MLSSPRKRGPIITVSGIWVPACAGTTSEGWRISSDRLQHRRSRLHFGEARGAVLERELVAAPQFHIPVLVDMRRRPGRIDRQPTARERDRKQRRAGQRRDHVDGAEPPWVGGDGAACGGERLRGLSDEGYPLRQYDVHAESLPHPCEHGIPRLGLPRDQASGARSTIEHEIAGEIP